MLKIKKIRENAKITQCLLAAKIGVTQACIASWETGKSSPTIEHLKKLSEIFGCTIDELLEKERG